MYFDFRKNDVLSYLYSCDDECNCQPKPDGDLAEQDVCEVCVDGSPSTVAVSVSILPTSVCVGETVDFQAGVLPQVIENQVGLPSHRVNPGAGNVSINFLGGGAAELTGTAPHSNKTRITFEPFKVIPGPACPGVVRETLVLPRNIATGDEDTYEVIPGLSDRFTALSFAQNNCPHFGVDVTLDHPIDGCSGGIHQDPTNVGSLFGPQNPFYTQQYNLSSTVFGEDEDVRIPHAQLSEKLDRLACNNHDICYQTCGNTQNSCDLTLRAETDEVCDSAYPPTCPADLTPAECMDYAAEGDMCRTFSSEIYLGLYVTGTFAYTQRQTQFCLCCE